MFDPRVHIQTDPQHSVVPGASFSAGGSPTRKADIVRDGVLENLTNSRYWATQKGRQPGPFVVNLVMDGEGAAISDMIKSTERGVLLTRLWYVRPVDPQQALVTGLTRDGTFFVENGKIAFPIKFSFQRKVQCVCSKWKRWEQRSSAIERRHELRRRRPILMLPAIKETTASHRSDASDFATVPSTCCAAIA